MERNSWNADEGVSHSPNMGKPFWKARERFWMPRTTLLKLRAPGQAHPEQDEVPEAVHEAGPHRTEEQHEGHADPESRTGRDEDAARRQGWCVPPRSFHSRLAARVRIFAAAYQGCSYQV